LVEQKTGMPVTPEILMTYIQNPGKLNNQSTQNLDYLLKKYPFFQTARLLHVKNLQNIHGTVDKQSLNLTAAYVTDRKVLYYLLHRLPENESSTVVAGTDENKPVTPEKDFKETLQENIAATLNEQIQYFQFQPEETIELIPGLTIDVRKEYGDGIELDDKSYSIGLRRIACQDEILELTNESEAIKFIDPELAQPDISMPLETPQVKEEIHENINYVTSPFEMIDEKEIEEDVREGKGSSSFTMGEGAAKSITEWLDSVEKYIIASEKETDPETSQSEEISVKSDTSHKKERDSALIDQFIKNNPKIVASNLPEENIDISAESVKEHESFFTDTLAQIYVKQGNYAKAILAYEKLSLKYPEKSAYFAGQISEIKKLISKS